MSAFQFEVICGIPFIIMVTLSLPLIMVPVNFFILYRNPLLVPLCRYYLSDLFIMINLVFFNGTLLINCSLSSLSLYPAVVREVLSILSFYTSTISHSLSIRIPLYLLFITLVSSSAVRSRCYLTPIGIFIVALPSSTLRSRGYIRDPFVIDTILYLLFSFRLHFLLINLSSLSLPSFRPNISRGNFSI